MVTRPIGINTFLIRRYFPGFSCLPFYVRIHIAVNLGNGLIRLIRVLIGQISLTLHQTADSIPSSKRDLLRLGHVPRLKQ